VIVAAVAPAAPASQAEPLDVTAESTPDTSATLAQDVARRAAQLLVDEHEADAVRQTRLDRLKADFDFDQQERAELLREMNVLREMAMEQQKKDDELLKKWIALI
jgi:hypothetical protein